MTTEERETLVRQTFELDRDIAFHTFRRLYIENPEIVQACPDPEVREMMLRGFWNQDAEKRFAEFQGNVSAMTVEQLRGLKAERQQELGALRLQRIVAGDGNDGKHPEDHSRTPDRNRKR